MSYHQNSHRQALVDLYPDVGLDLGRFQRWGSAEARREFFLHIAKELKFDGLNPYNWYNVTKATVLNFKVHLLHH